MDQPTVQQLCERLAANEPLDPEDSKCLTWPWEKMTAEQVDSLCQALKKNNTIKCVEIPGELDRRDCLSLTAALTVHPTVRELEFYEFPDLEDNLFNLFALAMVQNKVLNELLLTSCTNLTPSFIDGLCFILDQSALQKLVLAEEISFPEGREADLCAALGRNTSLKDFSVRFDNEESQAQLRILREIPRMLNNNRALQDLELTLYESPSNENADVFPAIFEAVGEHESLRKLRVTYTLSLFLPADMPDSSESNDNRERRGRALANMIRNATSLERLDISQLGSLDAICANGVADALRRNTSLRELYIKLDDCSGAASIARALTINSTLEELVLWGLDNRGIQSFSSFIPQMSGLKDLDLIGCCIDDDVMPETETIFLEALEQNTTLVRVSQPYNKFSDSAETKVQHLTRLNRGGRKILSSQSIVPCSLWPRILAKASKEPDVLYFFLQEKPDVLVSQNRSNKKRSRKRKRDQMCTIS